MKLQKLFFALAACVIRSLQRVRRSQQKIMNVKFTVKVENVSSKDLQTASDGSKWPFALSPGFWAVHAGSTLFQ